MIYLIGRTCCVIQTYCKSWFVAWYSIAVQHNEYGMVGHSTPWYIIWFAMIQYNTIQYNAIQYNTIQYNTNAVEYDLMHCSIIC